MLLGPALSRDGFAGAAQNTRHRGGGLVALVEKEQGGGQTRTEVTDDHLTIYPTGNLDDVGEFQWETRGPLYTPQTPITLLFLPLYTSQCTGHMGALNAVVSE